MSDVALAVIAIGRNEGDRLLRCLASVLGRAAVVIYVDSASTDGSAQAARGMGVDVVQLDMARPFTAARARNEGFARAQGLLPDLQFVQFVDGDCEVQPGWFGAALGFLKTHPHVAVVCGRRRERVPDFSIYNLLCDIEWDTPIGRTKACGGDAIFRADALRSVGGYRNSLIAGEEPELCVRLRATGWEVWRLAEEMTLHDAAMTRFSQWWKRMVRAGYAYAEGAYLHGAPPERHWVRETRSIVFWSMLLPMGVAVAWLAWDAHALAVLMAYPAQAVRQFVLARGPWHHRIVRAVSVVLANFALGVGHVKFWMQRLTRSSGRLIEYK